MAHLIDESKGIAAIASRGGAASCWHGLGQEILSTDSIEVIQRKAGLNFEVASAPVEYTDKNGHTYSFEKKNVTYRTDTGAALGIAGPHRNEVQPFEVLEFFDKFLKDNSLHIETAGALRGGNTVWALAELGPDFQHMLPGKDKIRAYVRLMTGFDSKTSTQAVLTYIRQVCANTEEAINVQDGKNSYRVSHSSVFDPTSLQKAIGLFGEQHKMTSALWNALAKRKVTATERDQFFCDVMGVDIEKKNDVDENGKPLISTRTRNVLDQLTAAFSKSKGADLKSAKGTAYGLLQAVTYWADHQAVTNDLTGDGKKNSRLQSAWFGLNAQAKADAQYFAAQLAGCSELVAA